MQLPRRRRRLKRTEPERKRIKGAVASFFSWDPHSPAKEKNPDKWWLTVDSGPWVSLERTSDDCWHIYICTELIPEDQRDPEGNPYLSVLMDEHGHATTKEARPPFWERNMLLFEYKPEGTLSDEAEEES